MQLILSEPISLFFTLSFVSDSFIFIFILFIL